MQQAEGRGERELYAREDCNRSDGAICQVHYKKEKRKKEREERRRRKRDRIKLGVERMKRKIKSVTSE